MKLEWIPESNPRWDADKQRIVGGSPAGTFALGPFAAGDSVPGTWWRAAGDGKTVGYGWMDQTWNGAEVLLAVDASARRAGVGTYILDRLEHEAASRGLNYMFNVVRPTHPQREAVTAWLESRGFHGSEGELRRRVRK